MEVASPLSFGQSRAGSKRHLPFSSTLVADPSNLTHFGPSVEGTEEILGQRMKRRRFNVDTTMDGDSENNVNYSISNWHQHGQQKELFPSSFTPTFANGFASKRCRTDSTTPQEDNQRLIQSQAAQIDSLKHEKSTLEMTVTSLRSEHEKVQNENKILKRAVTIQQERQNQAMAELQNARQYRDEAEDRIKKLEQIILSLRYHLQTQQSNPPNDFMGFPPRPPDVY